jgi:hypothetical protein
VTLSALIVAGTLLIATPKMRDPEFSKSVVLVIYTKDEGVIGIVLNRPMNGVHNGGPLPLGTNLLIQATQPPPAWQRVLPGVCLLSGKEPAARAPVCRQNSDSAEPFVAGFQSAKESCRCSPT